MYIRNRVKTKKSGKRSLKAQPFQLAGLRGREGLKRKKELDAQKEVEIAAQKKADLLTDVVQETPVAIQNITSIEQTSSVIKDSDHVTLENSNTAAVASASINIMPTPAAPISAVVSNVSPILKLVLHRCNITQSVLNTDIDCSSRQNLIVNDNISTLPILSAVKDTFRTERPSRACTVAPQVSSDAKKPSKTKKAIPRNHYSSTLKGKSESLPKGIKIKGRRIINFQFFFKALQNLNKHSRFSCNLSDIIIVRENKYGIRTSYTLRCKVCDFKKVLWSDPLTKTSNLNTDLVSYMIKKRYSCASINKLLTTMHLPSLCYDQLIRISDKIKKEISKTQKNSKTFKKKKTPTIIQQSNSPIAYKMKAEVFEPNLPIAYKSKVKVLESADLGALLIEDQFEIKEENAIESGDESEITIPDKTAKTSEDKLIFEQAQETLNMRIIKQEIESVLVEDEEAGSNIREMEIENLMKNNEQPKALLSEQKDVTACENTIIVNQEHINLHKTAMFQSIQNNYISVKFECSDIEVADKESMDNSDKEPEIELPYKKARFTIPSESGNLIEESLLAPTVADGKFMFLKPVHLTKSNFIAPQISTNTASGKDLDTNEVTYMPGAPTAVEQPVSSSDVSSNTNDVTYMQLSPAIPQFVDLSDIRPNWQSSNVDGPRWIGRANMNSSNSFFTLPGGSPKGVSDPVPPKPDTNQSVHPSKLPQFRCDDCDINFARSESLDSHRKSFCVKRLKLMPSSTVTSQVLMNNHLELTHMEPSFKNHTEELFSAMAKKRSLLEASIKTALDAQYIINLHKSAQNLTRKTFKELDDALNREKALMPGASFEEKQIVSQAKAQALMKAEAAYKQEKYSAAAVEQALYRQKTAIEATVTATGHEQTALITTLKNFKKQANQKDISSVHQTQSSNLPDKISSNQTEKLLNDNFLPEQTVMQQQINDTISATSVAASLIRSDFFMEQKNEMT